MNSAATPVLGSDDAPDANEVARILDRDIFSRQEDSIPDVLPEGKLVIAGIRFRTGGKTYFFDPGSLLCKAGQYAVVETARGLEFGEICIGNRMVDESMVVPPLRPVIRIATESDIAHNKENHEREDSAFRIGVEKIREHKLDMKLVSVQYTFDNSKLLFYFTSAGRVDFRELVKDLAGVFHIRIELRQIGIRDEARMIGGLGACGRPLCCTTFLSDFGQVSMKMAKEQNLSLNSTKISGCCGRLMCCLRYEYETYAEETQKTPAPGTFVNTPDGPGVVTEIFPLQAEVKVSLRGQQDQAPKRYKRELVEVQPRVTRPDPRPAEQPEGEPDTDE
ncbi:MAG: stage 0 sporulation family protein [Clostridia bacterium]|nr:stage 0 sporulation family protein [Clostridia bacterium]